MQRYKKYTLQVKNNAECECKLCVDACTFELSVYEYGIDSSGETMV